MRATPTMPPQGNRKESQIGAEPRSLQPPQHHKHTAHTNHRNLRRALAMATARSGAAALSRDSSYSVSGSESATSPAPRLHTGDPVRNDGRTDRDRKVSVAIESEVADNTAVHTALRRFQIV